MNETNWPTLANMYLPIKALFTGYLIAIGLGLLLAGAQILQTHGMADGEFGLSIKDIVTSYYGDRTSSKLESKLHGSMKDNAPEEVKAVLLQWARNGASEKEWETKVKPVTDQYCQGCHGNIPGLPKLGEKDVMLKLAAANMGATTPTLTRVSHIHLFGISFIFFFIGLIFSFATGFNTILKSTLIIVPFLFLVIDIAAWWLTRINPGFAWLVMIGGFGYTLASSIMILSSLYQMWIVPFKNRKA
jgi:hypothetical protein